MLVLSLLAVLATACSVTLAAPAPGPSLAPAWNAVALTQPSAATESGSDLATAREDAPVILALPRETRTHSGGSVTVEVTPAIDVEGILVLEITMNTHSVELDDDLTKVATLRDDRERAYTVAGWEESVGGHHRSGTLAFNFPAGSSPEWVELTRRDVGGVQSRAFRWEVK